jgi:hypothetical protein
MARATGSKKYLKTFFDEKGIDMEEPFTLEVNGVAHFMSYGVVVEAIMGAAPAEQNGIANALRRIDFCNGDVKHYLRHLAMALAANATPAADAEKAAG